MIDIPDLLLKSLFSGTKIDENSVYFLFRYEPYSKKTTVVLKTIYYEDPKKPTKQDILDGLKLYFETDQGTRKNFILFLSGHGYKDKFYLNTNDNNNNEIIDYNDISEVWLKRNYKSNDNTQHLLIIIDACYSGYWIDRNEELFHNNSHNGISVLSSCNYETSRDHPEYGGSLIFGINALNNLKNNDLKIKFKEYVNNNKYINYKPRFSGFYINIKRNYNLNIFLNGSYEDVSSLKYTKDELWTGYNKDNKYFLGTYYYNDGNRYEGEWKDGIKNGKGTYYFKSGDRYEGEWKDGIKNGKGTYYYNDGNRYEGEWKDNKFNGK